MMEMVCILTMLVAIIQIYARNKIAFYSFQLRVGVQLPQIFKKSNIYG